MTLVHSLRLRLLLVMVIVALAPVGTATYLIHRATEKAFHSYSTERSKADAQSIAAQFDALTGQPAVVVNTQMQVMAGSYGGVAGAVSGGYRLEDGSMTVATAGGESISQGEAGASLGGSMAVGGGAPGDAAPGVTISLPGLPDQTFLGAMTRALLIAVGLAAVGALVLAVLLARHILKPVETLTDAARGMAAGELGRRVSVHSQDEIGVLALAFNTMADSRARLEELRRNLVNDVAHELRTPLANLQGYLEVLRDGLTPPTPEVLAVLHDESLLLSRLVADLQELALAEAGELPLAPEAVAVTEPVMQALDAHRPLAGAKQLTLVAALPENLPPVYVDLARFSQILRNLLSNAITHTPAGGTIDVCAATCGNEMVVSVRDTGIGIPAEHVPYIFDRFYRADSARARATGGSGLGLAIVKHLVEAQGGRIDVASAVGAGTTFTFTLPLAVAPPAQTPALPRSIAAAAR